MVSFADQYYRNWDNGMIMGCFQERVVKRKVQEKTHFQSKLTEQITVTVLLTENNVTLLLCIFKETNILLIQGCKSDFPGFQEIFQ